MTPSQPDPIGLPKFSENMNEFLSGSAQEELLSQEEEQELAKRVEQGDVEARNRLVMCNTRLVAMIARKFSGRGWPLEDLIADGNLGLIRAADRYRVRLGTRFSTYASYWIQQSIRRSTINSARLIRLPAYMVETIGRWRRAEMLLEEDLGRAPLVEEVARRIAVPVAKISLILCALRAHSLVNIDSEEGVPLDQLATRSGNQTPEEILSDTDILIRIHEEVNLLPERIREVISRRYGIEDGRRHTLREVGDELHITRERVRQIELEGIMKLERRIG